MGERRPLRALGVSPGSIWGDREYENTVYAHALGQGRALIFRFHLGINNQPQSLSSRIVGCYHGFEVSDETVPFRDRRAMQSAIWSAVATVWPSCITEPATLEQDAVIDLTSNETGEIIWLVYREPLFTHYLDILRGIQPSDLVAQDHSPRIVDISEVILLEAMGGRGCCKQVQVQAGPGEPTIFVFKGIDFQTYLQLHGADDEFAHTMVETWRRSSKLIADMPPHPNIQSPPKILVSVRGSDDDLVLVGHLSTFFARGDLGTVIAESNSCGTQISLQQKAKWCHQMSLAVVHTHRVMHTFHMDIKPGNLIVDDDENLILIDWEQSGASPTTLAPEADGTWDVDEQDTHRGQRANTLVYTKYTGPERRNMPEASRQVSFNIWNVFPEWHESCPRALEAAEVFALGRTMWMLLSQTADDFIEVEHPNHVWITWGDENLPLHWIRMVEKCMDRDPNERPSVVDVAEFWEVEKSFLDSGPQTASTIGR